MEEAVTPKFAGSTPSLPVEVLHIIFLYFDSLELSVYRKWCPLMLVCRSWKAVAEMSMHSRLVYKNHLRDFKAMRQAVEQMRNKPHLERYIRILDMSVDTSLDAEVCRWMVNRVASNSGPVHTVIYQSMLEPSDTEIFTKIATFPLTHLSLRTAPDGIELQLLFDLFDLPTLRYLQVDSPAWNNKVDLKMYWELWRRFPRHHMYPYDSTDNTLHLEKVLPHNRRRKASIDSLTLSVPAADPVVAELLFLWPASLQSITVTQMMRSPYSSAYTSVVIQGFLEIHRESLRTIELPALPDEGLPDFSAFASLQRLKVHASSVVKRTPYEAWSKLAAPSLNSLTIDFSGTMFLERESGWIKQLAFTIKSVTPMCKPCNIFLEFCHGRITEELKRRSFPMSTFEIGDNPIWPWLLGHLKETRSVVASYGIHLTYSKPRPSQGGLLQAYLSPAALYLRDILVSFLYFSEGEVHVEGVAARVGWSTADVRLIESELIQAGLISRKYHDRDVWYRDCD
ncbi:hypothetical protein SI65_04665 [Aspergillus cristatus]|uniref:F-box domain-containing protein n=1 Tax=Aspergillus cristatus TaxID=573508 RepID=A0A1E3BFD2_ASPCR|nr:hypothetical protein SI65_04665 [Aspergillus cristatus]